MNEVKKSFKRKTIEKVIRHKMNHWFKTFPKEKKELVEKLRASYIVTGGAIASMLQGDMPNDYDVYFSDGDALKELADYYVKPIAEKNTNGHIGKIEANLTDDKLRLRIDIKSAGVAGEEVDLTHYSYFEHRDPAHQERFFRNSNQNKGKYTARYITSNAITLSDDIQIITRFIGTPEQIHHNFDFVHVTNYFTEETGLVLKQAALESIMTKQLRYVGSLFPIATMFRLKKFYKRGWSISAGDLVKIAWDANGLDLTDIPTLQEQLTGMDQAYFHEVIGILKNSLENTGTKLDRTYMFNVLTKVFDDEDSMEEIDGLDIGLEDTDSDDLIADAGLLDYLGESDDV